MVDFAAQGTPLSSAGLQEAATTAGIGSAELWAVISVETSGCGFLPDRRPKLLFERHVFHRLTQGRFDADDPDVSQPTAGGYGLPGDHQYQRLAAAAQFDRQAALKSASWGLGQVLGENFAATGFAGIEDMVAAMVEDEDKQLLIMAKFVKNQGMATALQTHDWQIFARRYNGPNFAAHNYDGLLNHYYQRYADGEMPDLQVRAVQIHLLYEGFSPGTVDGVLGSRTAAAIRQYQLSAGLDPTGTIDSALLARLLA